MDESIITIKLEEDVDEFSAEKDLQRQFVNHYNEENE